MKLKEFVDNLAKLMEERPETKGFDVITAKDEEGNGYDLITCYNPQVGYYDKDEREFYPFVWSLFQMWHKANAICIN